MSRVYFTDRDLGKRFPEILTAAGLTVERHHDLFPPDGSDEQWLEHCGTKARIGITHNKRIRYAPNERAAVMAHRVQQAPCLVGSGARDGVTPHLRPDAAAMHDPRP